MKFREYKNLTTTILIAFSPKELSDKVNQFGEEYDIIDLQYSTHFDSILNREVYSVFIMHGKDKI